MKITEAKKVTTTYHFVTTDETDWPYYRRWGPENWENLMGESWEPSYTSETTLEVAFQEWMNSGI
jgi:hypothetical protein